MPLHRSRELLELTLRRTTISKAYHSPFIHAVHMSAFPGKPKRLWTRVDVTSAGRPYTMLRLAARSARVSDRAGLEVGSISSQFGSKWESHARIVEFGKIPYDPVSSSRAEENGLARLSTSMRRFLMRRFVTPRTMRMRPHTSPTAPQGTAPEFPFRSPVPTGSSPSPQKLRR